MARVVAFIPDLLFGSNVLGAMNGAGHETVLVSDAPHDGVKTLAFYSHVEQDVRAQAEHAGFDLVIPRSRMAREGAAVLTRLLEGRG